MCVAAVMEATSESNHTDEWPWIVFLATTVYFTVECFLLIVCHGPVMWARDPTHLVDAFAIVGCWIAVVWPQRFCGFGSLRILRVLRLLSTYGGLTSIGRVSLHHTGECVLSSATGAGFSQLQSKVYVHIGCLFCGCFVFFRNFRVGNVLWIAGS